jgi:hypothetical protein
MINQSVIFNKFLMGSSHQEIQTNYHYKIINIMKRFQLNQLKTSTYPGNRVTWKLFQPFLLLVLLAGFSLNVHSQLPEVTIRFANPQYICPTQTYCLDVEFQSNTSNQWVYGVNVRFYYDDNELEYVGISDLLTGYISQEPPQILTGPTGSGADFGLPGPVEWFNGSLQLVSTDNPVYLATSGWTKMCKICFHVDNPNSLNIKNFCPTVVWDLRDKSKTLLEDGDGFQPGDDGVVVTVVDFNSENGSAPTFEIVEQFNWMYVQSVAPYGYPVSVICITTICGYIIPLSDWSLFLAIGLMVVATLFIYRRRISG